METLNMPVFRRGSTSAVLPPRGPSLLEIVRSNGLGAIPAHATVFDDSNQHDQENDDDHTVAGKALWQQPEYLAAVPEPCIEAVLSSQAVSCSVQLHPLWSLRDLLLSESLLSSLARAGVEDLWPMQCSATPLMLRGFNTLCAGPPKCGRNMAAMLAVVTMYANSTHLREAPRVVFVVSSDSQRRRCAGFLRQALKELDIEVATATAADADVFVLLPFAVAELSLEYVDLMWISRIDRFAVPPLVDHLPALQSVMKVANVVGASCYRRNVDHAGSLVPRRVVCCQEGDDFLWHNVAHNVELCPNEDEKVQYMCSTLLNDTSRLPCAVIVSNKKAQDTTEVEIKKFAPALRVSRNVSDVARGDSDILLLSDWSATALDCPSSLRLLINLSIPRKSALDVLTARIAEVFSPSARKYVCQVWTLMSSPSWTDRHASEVRQLLLETHQQIPQFLRQVT